LPSKGRSGGILFGVKLERFDIKVIEYEFAISAEVLDKNQKEFEISHSVWPYTG
jgi:hypothetical protein